MYVYTESEFWLSYFIIFTQSDTIQYQPYIAHELRARELKYMYTGSQNSPHLNIS